MCVAVKLLALTRYGCKETRSHDKDMQRALALCICTALYNAVWRHSCFQAKPVATSVALHFFSSEGWRNALSFAPRFGWSKVPSSKSKKQRARGQRQANSQTTSPRPEQTPNSRDARTSQGAPSLLHRTESDLPRASSCAGFFNSAAATATRTNGARLLSLPVTLLLEAAGHQEVVRLLRARV